MHFKVSIIVPLYNKVSYIEDTILSVLSQTTEDWELLIVDNCSTDGSMGKAESFISDRVHVFQCLEQGVCSARNYGLTKANGEWVLFLDADDIIEPRHIENLLSTYENFPKAGIIACGWKEVSVVDGTVAIKSPAGVGVSTEDFKLQIVSHAPWAVHAAIIRRSLFCNKELLWPEELNSFSNEDTTFWFKLIQMADVAYCDVTSAVYRVHVEDGRTEKDDFKCWFDGFVMSISLNIQLLKIKKIQITSSHHESIARSAENILEISLKKGCPDITRECARLARYHLSEYMASGGKWKLSLVARQVLGISTFHTLNNFLKKLRGKNLCHD